MTKLQTAVLLVILSAGCVNAVADEVITNLISSVVSYQYPNNLAVEVLTNGGVSSPITSYQFLEWPGDDVAHLLSSPTVSYLWQNNLLFGATVLHGRVTDSAGNPIAGATVLAKVYSTSIAECSSDSSGNYTMSSLDNGVYTLQAVQSAYQTSSRVLSLDSSTSQQDFRLKLLPQVPVTRQTSRQPPTSFTQPPIGPQGASLKIFNGTQFVAIDANNTPQASLMTIVLTHGWIIQGAPGTWGIDDWPTTMSPQLQSLISLSQANILAWDWRSAATGITPPEENTPTQGVALGQALQAALGGSYAQDIHFMGHSLGTMVNAAAANYVHGDQTAQQPLSSTPWSPSRTHMTLFDQAEVSRVASSQVLFDGLTVDLANPGAVLKYAAQTLQGWKPSMPVRSAWADNYISLVGFYLPNTFNIALEKAEGYAGLEFWNAHSYPMVWYQASMANLNDIANPLGFQRSFEYASFVGHNASSFPPIGSFALGDAYHQVPVSADQLALEPLPPVDVFQLIVPLFGNGADVVVQGGVATIQFVGNVAVDIKNDAIATGQLVDQGFLYAENVAQNSVNSVVNIFDSAVLHLTIHSSSTSSGGLSPKTPPTSNTGAMVWVPIQIPSNASAMAFDFIVSGDPVEDVLVCGVGDTNVFSLQAKFIPTNAPSSSRLIDVSQWAGTTNELFFGLMGGTSTNATLEIDNIRFFSLSVPRLDVSITSGAPVLTWPLSAGGYVLETTPSLSSGVWETVTNAPTITDRYVYTNSWSDQTRFFRLRQR